EQATRGGVAFPVHQLASRVVLLGSHAVPAHDHHDRHRSVPLFTTAMTWPMSLIRLNARRGSQGLPGDERLVASGPVAMTTGPDATNDGFVGPNSAAPELRQNRVAHLARGSAAAQVTRAHLAGGQHALDG